jgi:predicted transcriptional regulator
LNQISQTTPSLVPIYASLYAKGEGSLVDLIQKKQSWGEHLRRVKDAVVEAKLQISQENQRIVAGLNHSHEAELARRQAAANAMSQYLETQQIINNMNRPVTTNCNQFGNIVNCVSR